MFPDEQIALKKGYDAIKSEIEVLAGEGNADNVNAMGRAFEIWIMRNWLPDHAISNGYEIVWPTGNTAQFEAIGEDGGERQLDVGMLLRKTGGEGTADEYRAFVGQCVRPEQPENLPNADKMREVASAIANLNKKTGNDARKEFMEKLEEVGIISDSGETHAEHGTIFSVEEASIDGFFFCFGHLHDSNAEGANPEVRADLERAGHRFVDGKDLSRWHYLADPANAMMNTPPQLEINFSSITEEIDGVRLGIISAGSLHEFFTDRRKTSPYYKGKNQSLLYKNLRYQLPNTGTIGDDRDDIGGTMKTTLRDSPASFGQYNNGIVIVAQQIESLDQKVTNCDTCQDLEDNGRVGEEGCPDCTTIFPLRLHYPNIVNGGQTTNSIWEWINEEFHEVDGPPPASEEATLSVKVIPCDDDEEITKIARFANRQNPILPRDEYALDSDQERYFLFFEQRGIVFDYKRGVKAPLMARKADFELGHNSKTWKEIHNTWVAKRFLAAIGDPTSAFCIGDEMWKKEAVIKFIFSPNRTVELQRSASSEIQRLASLDLNSSREGLDDFASDALLWELIYRFSKRVKNFREERRKWIVQQQNWDKESDNYQEWIEATQFTSWWSMAVIRCFSMVIHHYSTGDNQVNQPDTENYNERREEIRQALIGEDYWNDDEKKKRIFGTGQTWNADISQYFATENTNRIMFNDDTSEGDFPLIAYWLKSIESTIMDIPVEQRSQNKLWKVPGVYDAIEVRIRAIIGNPAQLADKFPEEYPADPDEAQEKYDALLLRYDNWKPVYEADPQSMAAMGAEILESWRKLDQELPDDDDLKQCVTVWIGQAEGLLNQG